MATKQITVNLTEELLALLNKALKEEKRKDSTVSRNDLVRDFVKKGLTRQA